MPISSRIVLAASVKAKPPMKWHRRRWIWITGIAVTLALIGSGLWYVVHHPYLAVRDIHIQGVATISDQALDDTVREEISGIRWFVAPKNNFFMVSSSRVRDRLIKDFPQAAEIVVARKFPNSIRIDVRERSLWGVYCAISEETTGWGPCAYLDEDGIVFQEFSSLEGWLLPMIIGRGLPSTGASPVGNELLGLFADASRALADSDLKLLMLRESTSTPQDVLLTVHEGWEIQVPKNRPAVEWASLLRTLLEKEIGNKKSKLEYVDLRFGLKAFYKLKD